MDSATHSSPVIGKHFLDHHPDEDALERVLLNQADEDELEFVETHALACDQCITRLESLELFIQMVKMAAKADNRAQPVRARINWFSWPRLPRLSLAGVRLAACALAVTLVALSVRLEVPVIANRGIETTVVPQWVRLDLHLDARDLGAGRVNVEIVDTLGNKIWTGQSSIENGRLEAKPSRLTTAGYYLIRVSSSLSPAEPLREYSIQAKPLL